MKYLLIPSFAVVAFLTCADDVPARQKITLTEQYRQLIEGATVVDGYRMVRAWEVERLWKAVTDSLQSADQARMEVLQALKGARKEVAGFERQLAESKVQIEALREAAEQFTVLGIPFRKGTYRWISMAVIAGLLILAGIQLLISRAGIRAALEARSMYENLYKEFDAYRHNAVERQIKLSRELQDYRNRYSELRSA
jgi:phage shock protein A